MLGFLPAPLKGLLSATLFGLNVVFWCLILYPIALVKMLVPPARSWADRMMTGIGERWIAFNVANANLTQKIRWDVQIDLNGGPPLRRDASYLVIANHMAWSDIVVLQQVFNRKIPFLKFFLKKQLLYVPLLGWAWWALDFPFMKRYSRSYLEKHPEKRGEDLATTRKACARFKGSKISILNFLEGTRFTAAKHASQRSPFKHLLMPKAGGVAFVLEAMGDQFDSLLDVTIHYPGGVQSLWGMLSGKLTEIVVRIKQVPIPREVLGGNYLDDSAFRERMQAWVTELWRAKDQLISQLEAGHRNPTAS